MRTHFTYEAEPLEAYTDFELEFEINRSSRDYIKWVQTSLNRIIGARLVVDGISGSQTREAVQTFQRQKGLTADGIVGPITEGALIAAGASRPPGGAGGAPSSGTPGLGSPSSAIDTFLPYSGPGYESKYTSSDLRFNQYGRSEAILALQWIAREWQRKHPNGPKLYIGPISKRGGGTLCYSDGMCHAEHKDGLDIDIRPVRNDQSKGGLTFNDPSYSRQLTQEFVDLAWSNRCVPVEKILFNDPAVSRVNYSSGHDDHLHVSFRAPSGSLPAECRSTGSGYGWELSEELEQDWEEFLDDFWGSSGQSEMESETKITMDSYAWQHLMDRGKRFPNPSHLKLIQNRINRLLGMYAPAEAVGNYSWYVEVPGVPGAKIVVRGNMIRTLLSSNERHPANATLYKIESGRLIRA